MEKLPTPEFSLSIADDGAVIFVDGEPLTPERIIELLKKGHRDRQLSLDFSNIINDLIAANQSAWIEWQHGSGAESAMTWIRNVLWGPGLIPDENAPWGKDAQYWYNANTHDPFPTCICGNPSSILSQGLGACCHEHLKLAKAERAKND